MSETDGQVTAELYWKQSTLPPLPPRAEMAGEDIWEGERRLPPVHKLAQIVDS